MFLHSGRIYTNFQERYQGWGDNEFKLINLSCFPYECCPNIILGCSSAGLISGIYNKSKCNQLSLRWWREFAHVNCFAPSLLPCKIILVTPFVYKVSKTKSASGRTNQIYHISTMRMYSTFVFSQWRVIIYKYKSND